MNNVYRYLNIAIIDSSDTMRHIISGGLRRRGFLNIVGFKYNIEVKNFLKSSALDNRGQIDLFIVGVGSSEIEEFNLQFTSSDQYNYSKIPRIFICSDCGPSETEIAIDVEPINIIYQPISFARLEKEILYIATKII